MEEDTCVNMRMGVPNVRQLASLELVEASASFGLHGLVEASCISPAPAEGQQKAGRRGSARTGRRRATEIGACVRVRK